MAMSGWKGAKRRSSSGASRDVDVAWGDAGWKKRTGPDGAIRAGRVAAHDNAIRIMCECKLDRQKELCS